MGFCGLLDVVVAVLAVPNEEAPDKGIGGRIIPLLGLKNVSTFNRETKELGNFTYGPRKNYNCEPCIADWSTE